MKTSIFFVPIPKQGTSVEAFLARQAHILRMHLQRRLEPAVVEATGIIAPNIDPVITHLTHLEDKHA